jgi:hypothetical protein
MITVIASIALSQFVVMGPEDHPPGATLISPAASARFALERVCGPAAAADQPIPTGRALIPIRGEPGVFLVLGVGRVAVRQERDNACYFRVDQGDAAGLRQMVLERLEAAGTRPVLIQERRAQGAAGEFRMEFYCLDFNGQAGAMVMSTALGRRGYRLQATLIPRSRSCAARAATA